jgi:tetratricopeptide (TPR) repeat protein
MMRFLKCALLSLLVIANVPKFCRAQNTIDSLLKLVKVDNADTSKVIHSNKLSWEYKEIGNYKASLEFSNSALLLSQKLDYKKGIANSYSLMGNVNAYQSNYPLALEFYQKALGIDEELKDQAGKAIRLGNIGLVYWQESDYPKALDFYFDALKIGEELGDKNRIAIQLSNIGLVYADQGDYSKALEYYFKALKIDEELKDQNGIASDFSNIGIANEQLSNYYKALTYYSMALKMDEELGNKNSIAIDLRSIGIVYCDQGDSALAKGNTDFATNNAYPKAFDYYSKAMKLAGEIGDKNEYANNLGNIGSLYTSTGNYKLASAFLYRALAVSDSIGSMDLSKSNYEMLSTLYEKSSIPLPDSIGGQLLNKEQMRLRSLHYLKSFMNLRDTIFSQENKKQLVRKELNYEFEKKEAETKADQDKKDILAKEELDQKEKERNYFIVGFALVVLLAGFIFRGYRQKQKANEIISQQKLLVEEKQKEILDSIQYAKRIQRSLLPTEKYLEKILDRLKKGI